MTESSPGSFITLSDFEAAAREKLPPMIWDYFSGGAQDEITLRENRAVYDRIPLHYRVMRGVANRDLTARVLGQTVSFPVLVPPMAFQALAHEDAETAMVRAAGKLQTVMALSMLATTAVEDVVEAASAPVWMQLYLEKDRSVVRDLVRRAEQAGCKALVLTVDSPVFGRQERNLRNRFELPRNLLVRNLLPRKLERLPRSWSKINQHSFEDHLDPSLTWRDVSWLCSITRLPVLVKGVVRPDDAILAVQHGAKGVIVSNHGGRQLDTSPATISVLADVAGAVGNQCDVLVDGGIRRGTDVIKALALGAKAVLVGRPLLWGLASNGQAGVEQTLEILRTEFDSALALCGCRSIAEITPDLVRGPAFEREIKALQSAATSGE